MFNKMMLLAMAVGALVAFAAPATASASTWDTEGVPIVGEDEVHFTGTLSSTKGGLKISCNATANVDVWNDETLGAHGEVTSLTLSPDPEGTDGCTVAVLTVAGYVDLTNCHVAGTAENLPGWTVTTNGNHLTIDSAAFVNRFTGAGCLQHLGIPEGFEVTDTGNAEGEVVGGCIVFSNAGPFVNGSRIDGQLCATGDLTLTS